jgi:protein-disulfide isomerase
MNNQPKSKSGAPMMIIGLVLLVAIIGGIYFYASSRPGGGSASKSPTPAPAKVSAIPPNAPIGANPPNMKGAPNAVVTVEEFADFQCPTCASVYTVMNQVHAAYGSRIKFIYRNFPLTQIHKNSYDASVAAEAAYLQDANKFWDMQNQLFTNQAAWSNLADPRPVFKGYAEKIGLDVAKWENDVAGLPAKTRVNADMERGKAINITGTPSIYINGQPLAFAQFNFDAIKGIIDAELAKGPNAQNPAPAQPQGNANSNK